MKLKEAERVAGGSLEESKKAGWSKFHPAFHFVDISNQGKLKRRCTKARIFNHTVAPWDRRDEDPVRTSESVASAYPEAVHFRHCRFLWPWELPHSGLS
jgi:hypothetical protein